MRTIDRLASFFSHRGKSDPHAKPAARAGRRPGIVQLGRRTFYAPVQAPAADDVQAEAAFLERHAGVFQIVLNRNYSSASHFNEQWADAETPRAAVA